ncbi:uncharacterized protein LOC141659860 [Apium graveolens]|uniref:uncharacterized protein LOC141659860 n=1 Tax=Apium graveolens TaxID=4045 RepID=UPI003D79C0AE
MALHHGRLVMNHRVFNLNREESHERFYHDYFFDTPTYSDEYFSRRFLIRRSLFLRIQEAVILHDNYLTQISDAVRVRRLSSPQKITAAHRMLAHGISADATDDYVKITEMTTIEKVKGLCLSRSKTEYLWDNFSREINEADVVVYIGEDQVPVTNCFKYLGSIIDSNMYIVSDVTYRIKAGWVKWRATTRVLYDKGIPLKLNGTFYKAMVRPSLLYGSEC